MGDHNDTNDNNASTQDHAISKQAPPTRELELKLKKNPEDPDTKTDVGSDESMDASDPIASTQPGKDGPAPSSGFPED